MSGKYDSANTRIGVDRVAQAQTQVEAGPLPRQPSEFAAEDFARESFAVARRRDRDDRIGMDMIDVRERQERMKRSIDAGGARAAGKGAIVEVRNELIFVLAAAKAPFQCDEFVLIQLREAGQIHRAQIVAGSFHPQNRHALVVERIDVAKFCRGVAAAEIGHAEIGAQQMRAIQKQLGFRERFRVGIVPSVDCHARIVTRRHGFSIEPRSLIE